MAAIENGRRPLPTDPTEREKALQLNALPAELVMSGLNNIAVAADVRPFNATERAEGAKVTSALLYEYGMQLSAAGMAVIFIISVIVPRVVEWLEKKKKERKEKDLSQLPARIAEAKASAA